MSIKLPFKPIFAIDYDEEILDTVKEQTDKYLSVVQEVIEKKPAEIPAEIRESLQIFISIENVITFLPRFFLSVYFLERSFIKMTYDCLTTILTGEKITDYLKSIEEVVERWPKELRPLITIYHVSKGSEDQKIFQLTDFFFRWINSYIPVPKRHEFKLFDDSFHKNFLLSNEDSLISEFGLAAKKKIILPVVTKSFSNVTENILKNIQENKLSVLIGDSEALEAKFLLFFIIKEINKVEKRILFNNVDFFKLPFAEFFNLVNISFISNNLDLKSFQEQYELLNALRNTPSLILVSTETWAKFEPMKVFTNELSSFVVPRLESTNSDEKEYLYSFITNYLDKSNLKLDVFEKNDLIETLIKKSSGSLNYLDTFISHTPTLFTDIFDVKKSENLPQGDVELAVFLFKSYFVDNKANVIILLTLLGLSSIQFKVGRNIFTKSQILKFKNAIHAELRDSTIENATDDNVLTFCNKVSNNVFTFSTNWLVKILKNPFNYFDDDKTEDVKLKKLFLIAQNFITSLPTLEYEKIFIKVLIENLKDNLENLLDLQYLITLNKDFIEDLKTINYSKENLVEIMQRTYPEELSPIKKNFFESVNYLIYSLEYQFDQYLVNGQYAASQNVLELFEAFYKFCDDEQKIRIHFQKARQLIAQGSIEHSYQELEKTIPLIRKSKSYFISGLVLRLLGEVYFINRQPVFGNYAFDQVIQIFSRIIPEQSRFKAYTLLKFSDRLNEFGLFAQALQILEDSFKLFQHSSLLLEIVNGRQKTADLLYKLGSTELAIKELQTAIHELGDKDPTYVKQLEGIKQAFEYPEIVHPLYNYKNWIKLNYVQLDSLQLQESKYSKIFTDTRDKELTEDTLPQIIQYLRILFKLGKIDSLRLALDYVERNIAPKLHNRGLIYLELSLIHNWLGNIDIGNYYSDLARSSLYILPVDFEISSLHQINYIVNQLYLGNYEYAELLLQDQFLRKKKKNESLLNLCYAFLEMHKNSVNYFETFYERGIAQLIEKSSPAPSKNDVKKYAPMLSLNQYEKIFPLLGLSKKDVQLLKEIAGYLYKATIDATKGLYNEAVQHLAKIIGILNELTSEPWKKDIQINYYKRMGQIFYADTTNASNQKKSLQYWQEALRIISTATKDEPLLYLFEKLDLLYLIGKNGYKFSLLTIEESTKYLISGKNLITRNNIKNNLRLEFQFDTALGNNYFESKEYEQAEKYYLRALEKHENKLYMELGTVLRNLAQIYVDRKEKDKLQDLMNQYSNYLNVFNIKEKFENLLKTQSN